VLIINGRNDDNSPVSVIDVYVKKLQGAGKTVETYLPENGPHGFYFGRPEIPESKEAAKRAVEFLEKCFAPPAGEGKGKGGDYGTMVWVDPDRSEPGGTKYKTFRSAAAGGDVSYLIYLPPGYEGGAERYPVVYSLHGSGGMPSAGGEVARRFDRAIRAGRVPPIIVVFPNGLRGATMYCDSRDGKWPVESVIIKDLIPHIDATYRTLAGRENRAVDGFSMGGFGAAHYGFKYPELFGVVSIMAPAMLGPTLTQPRPVQAWSRLFPSQMAMGGDMEYFKANDPFELAVKNAAAIRDRMAIRIVAHAEPENWLAPRCEEMHRLLMGQTIPHAFYYLSNVKSHDRAAVMDTMGDAGLEFFASGFEYLKKTKAAR
jgi:endo-1,4-beta-xylanase